MVLWRSRRGGSVSSSTATSSTSSSTDTGGNGLNMFSDDGAMDLESIAEQVFEHLSIAGSDTTPCYSDLTSTHSQDARQNPDSKEGRRTPRAKSRTSTQAFKQDGRLCLNFVDAMSGAPNRTYYKLFRGILSWINPDINVFVCSDKTQCFSHDHELHDNVRPHKRTVDIPDLAVVLFLQEEQTSDDGVPGKMSQVKEFFQHKPWRFHHSEFVGQGRIQACPQSSHDYFFVKHDFPLCSVRQIHCGEEHVRLVRFITLAHWKDSIKLYSLLLGQEADAMKQDFCVFTVEKFGDVDLQLALKKLPKGIEPRHTRKCVLSFKVNDIGYLVPLLPHTCVRIAEHRWKTHDLDRNEIHIVVEDTSPKPIRAPLARHSHAKSSRVSHVRQHSSSSEASLSCSAFTPVQGSIDQLKGSDSRLSPRVFLNKSPELGSKVQNGLTLRQVYSEQEYEQQHTDSGFMEERSDDSTDNHARLQLYTTQLPSHRTVPPQHPTHTFTNATHSDFFAAAQSTQSSTSDCDTLRTCNLLVTSENPPLCHSSPKTDHPNASPTWDTVVQDNAQDTTLTNSARESTVAQNTQDTAVVNNTTHSTPYSSTYSRNSISDSQAINSPHDTCPTVTESCSQDNAEEDSFSRVHHCEREREHCGLPAAMYPAMHPAARDTAVRDTATRDPAARDPAESRHSSKVVQQCDAAASKPSLPSYHQAVSLLAAQRHEAGLRSAKLLQESKQQDCSTHASCDTAGEQEAVFTDDDVKEGEPEVGQSVPSILTDTTRRTVFQRRASSNGKRVRFNDINENFTYEPVQVGHYTDNEGNDDDVFVADRVANKAEGSECTYTYDEASEYCKRGTGENGYLEHRSDLHWHSSSQGDSDVGFYI